MKRLLAVSCLLLVVGCWSAVEGQDASGNVKSQTRQTDAGQTSNVKSEELKGYEAFNYTGTIDGDIANYRKSLDQRIGEIKYVLGLVGITSESTIQEAASKDATCLRLDTAIRLLGDQKKNLADVKIFKKAEEKK